MADTKKPGHYNVFTGKRNPGEAVLSRSMEARLGAEAKKQKKDEEDQKDIAGARSFRNRVRNDRLQSEQDRKYMDEVLEKPPGKMLPYLEDTQAFKKGGMVKKMAKGGSASKRADGCAVKGKTKGRII
jgi:hypothetical protein